MALFHRLQRAVPRACTYFDRRLVPAVRDAARFGKGRLLDVGCGTKPFENYFDVKQYVGIDVPSSEIRDSKRDISASGMQMPFKDGFFDTVLCTEVLEHVPEPHMLLTEINRVMKKGGCLILSTPQSWSTHGAPHDYYRYTEFGLWHLAKKSGFRVVSIKSTTGTFSLIGQFLSQFIWHTHSGWNSRSRVRYVFEVMLLPVCLFIQAAFLLLDKIYGNRGDVLNNVMVARKNS